MDTDQDKKTATVRPFAKAVVDKTECIRDEVKKDTAALGAKVASVKPKVESGIKKSGQKAEEALKKAGSMAAEETVKMTQNVADKATEEKARVSRMAADKGEQIKKAAAVKSEQVKKEAKAKTEAVKKAAVIKSEEAKKAAKKKETEVKNAAAEKVMAAKKEVKKTIEKTELKNVKTEMHIQFAGKSYTTEDLVKIAKDVWQFDLNKKPEEFRSIEFYVKPEENITYYVINGNVTGSFYI